MSERNWREEAELLRAQLIQCTTAMREVCDRLENTNLADADEVLQMVNESFDTLYTARATPVTPVATQDTLDWKEEAELLRAKVDDLGKQVRQAGDSLAAAHRRRETAAKQAEELRAERDRWEKDYRKLALENLSLLGQLNESEDTFAWYEAQAARTAVAEKTPVLTATILALGLCTEAGEAGELVKKWAEQGRPFELDRLKKELGDTLWYLTRLAAEHGIKLADIAQANVAKLQARYPNGFVAGGGVR